MVETLLLSALQVLDGKCVTLHAEAGDETHTFRGDQAFVPKLFACVNIGDVNFHNRGFNAGNGIMNRHRGMRVCTCIENDPMERKACLMEFVNDLTLNVRLKV